MRSVALLLVCAALVAPAPARAQEKRSVDALETWINAVNAHRPGTTDRAAGFIASFKYSERAILNPAMRMFLVAMSGGEIAVKTLEQRRVLDLFLAVRRNPGEAAFLERAAVLHADAAIFRDKLPDFADDAPPPPRAGSLDGETNLPRDRRTAAPQSALLTNDIAMVHTDGRVIGQAPLNWNWPFARSLLDLLQPRDRHDRKAPGRSDGATAPDPAFVAEWYHATAAYLLGTGRHADLHRHLAHAAVVLPDDARVLFDRACYAETLGLPLYQVLPGDAGYWSPASRIRMDVPSEDKTDEEAEALFRRAIEVDPQYAEARVRLARLLERRGLHDEAASQIDQALAVTPRRTVAYFAHLVAGRIALTRGRAADALGHYRAALAIFPDAQSALLGASQAAAIDADVTGALALVQKLGDRSAAFDADPWWSYHFGAGRDVDDLMAALWKRITAPPR